MSSLFAVLPAAALDSAEQAYERYLSLIDAPEPGPPERSVGVVCTLIQRYGTRVRVQRRPEPRGALLESTGGDRFDCLRALLALTADRDLAVLDIATRRFYTPRGATRIQVTTGDITLPYLTESILDEILETPPDPSDPGLQVTRAPMCHIRARLLPDEVFELEHRDLDAFFRLYTDSATLVRKIVWTWAVRDPWWQEAIAWQPVEAPVVRRRPPEPADDIDAVLAEMRRMADEPPLELGALGLLSTFDDLDSRTQAILDRAEPETP